MLASGGDLRYLSYSINFIGEKFWDAKMDPPFYHAFYHLWKRLSHILAMITSMTSRTTPKTSRFRRVLKLNWAVGLPGLNTANWKSELRSLWNLSWENHLWMEVNGKSSTNEWGIYVMGKSSMNGRCMWWENDLWMGDSIKGNHLWGISQLMFDWRVSLIHAERWMYCGKPND